MENYNLTKMAVDMFCPGNVVQLDDAGLPSVLVWIPAFKNSDVLTGGDDSIHPAFIVNGVQISGFYYGKYQATVYNGKAYSLPAEDPATRVNFDTARQYCEGKGYGWHLSTAAEWAAIALWCQKNGRLPYGNNSNGKDGREGNTKAIPACKDNSGVTRVATGTGPLTWSHDGTASGIWDMNGNIWEWQGGLRLVWGELQVLVGNDAADPDNPQTVNGMCWKAINAKDGTWVDPECSASDPFEKTTGNTVKLDFVNDAWTFSTGISDADSSLRSCSFSDVTCTSALGDAAQVRLRALALLPDADTSSGDYDADEVRWSNQNAELILCRGGCYDSGNGAGVFSQQAVERGVADARIGFRCAYIPNI